MDASTTQLAERIRTACIAAATDAWEDAGMQGLCGEGRWEVAIGALRTLDLNALLAPHEKPTGTPSGPDIESTGQTDG